MGDLPIYKFGLPFDNIKIIFNTLVGDPRYHFKPDEVNCVVAHSELDKDVFKVNTILEDESDLFKYAESIIHKDEFTNIKEFGNLFYNFGTLALTQIAGSLLKINCFGREALSNDIRVAIDKLGITFNRNFFNFLKMIGVMGLSEDGRFVYVDKKICHLEFERFVEDIDFYYDSAKNKESYVEFGNIFSATYLALTLYLNGIIINLSDKLGVELGTIYSNEGEASIDTLSNNLIASNAIESDIKFKLISLIYTHYLMTKFYEDKSGFDFKDSYIKIFYNIGEKISKLGIDSIGEELDISHLTQSDLVRNSKINMLTVLGTVDIINTPATFDVSLFEHEISDMSTVAFNIANYLWITDLMNDEDGPYLLHSPFCGSMTDDINENVVDKLYNYFIDNVINLLPHTISPKFFYRLCMYAAAFRFIKEKKNGKMSEQAALGLYQAEACMAFLYRKWFDSRYYYEISSGIKSNDVRRVSNEIKALAYVHASIYEYQIFTYILDTDNKRTNSFNAKTFITNFNRIMNELCYDNIGFSELRRMINNDLEFEVYKNDNTYPVFAYISDFNFEKYDDNVKLLNSGRPLIEFYIKSKNNGNMYNIKYINKIIETEFETKTLDKLSEYCNSPSDYSTMYDCKLSRGLSGNISKVISNEKSDDRFEIYFNVFVKYIIPIYLAHIVFDKTDRSETDKLGNTIREDDDILPNIHSQRLFNFLNRS